jgi:hypothetical protein
MLFVCISVSNYDDFKELFRESHTDIAFHDLSKVSSDQLAAESSQILQHYDTSAVFLGYIEPGWMLQSADQITMRSLFRKFPVGMVCNYTESLPFSWKNGIDTVYTSQPTIKNGYSSSLNDGSAIQDQSTV